MPARGGTGCDAPDPIFILGMPRAGSTLIEQILASHSAIEGTAELPDIPIIAARAKAEHDGITGLDAATLRALARHAARSSHGSPLKHSLLHT